MELNENTLLLLTTFVMQNNLAEFTETLKSEDMALYLNATNYRLIGISGLNPTNQLLIPVDSLGLIHIAAYYDSFEMLLYLCRLGLSLTMQSGASYYPLHYACAGRALECAAYILEQQPEQAREDILFLFYLSNSF